MTSKGQITLPKLIRLRLGIQTGSRIRFVVDAHGQLQGEPVLYDLEDLWAAADQGPQAVQRGRTAVRDHSGQSPVAVTLSEARGLADPSGHGTRTGPQDDVSPRER